MARLQVIKGGDVMGMGLADYLWVGPKGDVMSKKKTILIGKNEKGDPVPLVQRWSFEEKIHKDHCCNKPNECDCGMIPQTRILVPCFFLPDPTRPQPNYLVLCEVRDAADQCLPDCHRSTLRKAMDQRGSTAKLVWFGFEQDYALEQDTGEADLSEKPFLASERHLGACFDAGLLIHSAFNMPGYVPWDFKVGVRGFPQDLDPDPPSALVVADHLVIARYIMQKIGGEKGLFPEWQDLSIFVSTPELREIGGGPLAATLLMTALARSTWNMRLVPHPVHGGCQCVEIQQDDLSNPYELALDVLEAVWPLSNESIEPEENQ